MRIVFTVLYLSGLLASLTGLAACQCSGPQESTAAVTTRSAATATTASAPTASATADPQVPIEPAGPAFESDERADVIIQGGTVIDGTGGPALRAEVVISGGDVVHVGKIADGVTAKSTIDATGKMVTPGFIDTHAHGDPLGNNANFLTMGVTTIVVGQDGVSPSNDRVLYWKGNIKKRRLAVNVVPFVGHGTVRSLAKVGASREPSEKQIARMARLVKKELDAGAWGLSTGLEYTPGRLATTAELAAIAKPVAEVDGLISSHLRSEDDDTIEAAIGELVAQGKASGARIHVSHIKVVYGKGEKRAIEVLAILQKARDDGVKVTADIYPYNASYTSVNILFPSFAKPPANYKRVTRERRDELETFIRDKVTKRGGPEATLFGSAPFTGLTLKQVAEKKGKPFEAVLIDDIGLGGASAAYFVMDDALQSRLLIDPHVMIATDGGAHSRHPRGYGTFAKVIREHVIERKTLTIIEVVRKMSGLPAETLRLEKRGLLKAGYAADVLVFDPKDVRDRANYEKPNLYAEGISWALVNGKIVIAEGERNKRKGGKLLLRQSSSK